MASAHSRFRGVALLSAMTVFALASASKADEAASAASTQARVVPALTGEVFTGDLEEIRKRGTLRALVSFSKTDFFLDGARPLGLQAELLALLEKSLNEGVSRKERGIRVVYVPVSFDRLLPALVEGRGDIAVGTLTVTDEREELVDFVVDKRDRVDELVVTAKGVTGLEAIEDLAGRQIHVMRGSSYAEHLRRLSSRLVAAGMPPIDVREAAPNLVTEDLLELANAGVIDITVSDDYKAKLWGEVLPDINVLDALKVNADGTVGWAVRKENPELREALEGFSGSVQKGTLLGNVLLKRYYANTRWIKNPLADEERDKLDALIGLFQRYSEQYEFDWLAIAAQAYQESKLDHSTKSSAGAVGIMQLLPSTASDPNVAIPEVEDLEKNIHAGTKYMAFLRERYFNEPELDDENRFAFTWAAYNAGPARVRQMRKRAEEMGLDRNRWFGNVEHAALAIVGQETVRYVSNIYKYYVTYSLLEQQLAEKQTGLETLSDVEK